ncbi:MAG TPA: OmpH family outer membrane protein [Thermoanaerobaculaceae bacterium]|nr:OmpH family outer membrane protein [Thermoanaerobaculaceae bacterium]HPS78798.1 OmpH family outer membrane protein [Thermoanaerobaculaceae bacterium]
MKRYATLLVVVGLALTGVQLYAQEAPKLTMAVIDVQVLVQESAAGKEAMGRLAKMQNDKVTERKKLSDEFDGLQKQLATQGSTLSEAKLAELRKSIEDKEIVIRRFDDDAQQELEKAKTTELGNLEKQIMPIIQELGREMKLQMVFNKFQSGLVYADETVDITDQVLRRFNTKVTTTGGTGK